ncbi:dipeptidase [Fundidesulfovibrio butyratiphilus]
MKLLVLVALVFHVLFSQNIAYSACTTTIVTKGASADGSVMVSHSDDDELMDQSIVYVPAKDWPKGAKRPVYDSAAAIAANPATHTYSVPRLSDPNRAPGYNHPKTPRTIPIGFIPQVRHTYAYLDGNYGILNEHGLMFGECTDGAFNTCKAEPGKRIFYSSELSRVALERCKTAREALQLMGELIERYGYFGTGETLTVADKDEAWVMEMAPSPAGVGGLWVAQRVPDGEFFIAANEFRIRDITPDNPDQMYGKTLFETVDKFGMRNPKDPAKPMDWLTTVSEGEYNHPYYSLRRVWRALSLAAPSLNLPAWVENGTTRAYPFSVKPDKPLALADLKRMHRDHYEGTEFDLTQGIAAGPFGNPNRVLGPTDPSGDVTPARKLQGAWERPLGMVYSGYTYINQYKPDEPAALAAVCWMALDTAAESVFVPLAVAPLPKGYEQGDTRHFSNDSAWWTYALVAEYANTRYSLIAKDIHDRACRVEHDAVKRVAQLRKHWKARADKDPKHAQAEFSKVLCASAEETTQSWREFFPELVAKYCQGFVNSPDKMAVKVGYPEQWLERTNYFTGPTSYEKAKPETPKAEQ